jgi:ABC-type multidrug transport system fused ATPase/permease subunit
MNIQSLNIHSVRSQFGLVSQEPILFDMTITENIAYSQEKYSFDEIIDAATKANIHHFILQLPQASV